MKYIFFFLLSFPALAKEIVCPPELKTEQKSVDAPKGWKVYEEKFNSRHVLTNVEFYSGHPDDGARLAPSSSEKEKTTWKFEKKDQSTLVCRYAYTLLTLTQELKDLESCEVELDKAEKPKKINCQ